jgi:ADP-ribose pyrophosphatase YjhB (NUDIX family)
MISEKPPKNYKPVSDVVCCFMKVKDKILFLHRVNDGDQGNLWGLPGGTVEKGETLKEALFREIMEETNVPLKEEEVVYLKKIYVRYPKKDFNYHMFYAELKKMPVIETNPEEHIGFLWITPLGAMKLPLVKDGKECIELFIRLTEKI